MGATAIKAIGMLPITCNPGHTELEVSLHCLNKQQRNNIITMRNKEQQRNNKQRKNNIIKRTILLNKFACFLTQARCRKVVIPFSLTRKTKDVSTSWFVTIVRYPLPFNSLVTFILQR